MKNIVLGICLMLLFQPTFSQIPIVLSGQNFQIGPQHMPMMSKTGTVSNPSEGANQLWDYSQVAGFVLSDTAIFENFSGSPFPANSLKENNLTSSIGSFNYNYAEVREKNGAGYFSSGQVLELQLFNISNVTGGSDDSIIIYPQSFAYPESYERIRFPATYQSTWSGSYNFGVEMLTRVPSIGSYNAVLEHRVYETLYDTVAAWGKIIIPTPTTGASLPIEVLMVKNTSLRTDSFYINGTPANIATFQLFGIMQGVCTAHNKIRFLDVANMTPVAEIDYGTSYFTNSVGMKLRSAALPQASIQENEVLDFQIYPNPVQDRIFLSFAEINNEMRLIQIFDLNGKCIMKKNTNEINSTIPVENWPSGIYHIQVSGKNQSQNIKFVKQ